MLNDYIQLTFDGTLASMDETPHAKMRPQPMARPVRMELGAGSPEHVRDLVEQLLAVAGLSHEDRLEVLGLAFVNEAVALYWTNSRTAEEAHAALRADDPPLAEAVEGLAPGLYGRAAVRAAEALLGYE